jgi:hypothetical protein
MSGDLSGSEQGRGKGLAWGRVLVYYTGQMNSRIKYSMRMAILVLYCIYAISPIYLSAMAGRNGWVAQCGHEDKSITLGIVWVNVLLSKFLPVHQCVQAAPPELLFAKHNREFILIKKIRAVLRESVQVKPESVQQADGPSAHVPAAKPLIADNAPLRKNIRSEDLANFCHGGLSPPQTFRLTTYRSPSSGSSYYLRGGIS